MDFFGVFSDISSYLKDNIWVAIAIAAFLIFLFYNRPKIFIVVLVFGLILSGVLYLISNIASTGTSYKSKIVNKGTIPP